MVMSTCKVVQTSRLAVLPRAANVADSSANLGEMLLRFFRMHEAKPLRPRNPDALVFGMHMRCRCQI